MSLNGSALRDLSRRFGGKVLSARVYPEFFPIDPTDWILNLGCGEGTQLLAYDGEFAKVVGLDVSRDRLGRSRARMDGAGIDHYDPVCALAESTPLKTGTFDKALAIDIIEHVVDPLAVCSELHRLLRPGGRLLITFPAMHDRFADAVSFVSRVFPGRARRGHGFKPHGEEWNPDAHNHELPLEKWVSLVESSGFVLRGARASTLFPPLHLYGVPRFWFSNDLIHAVDARLCAIPGLRRLGQALLCDFERSDRDIERRAQ